LRPLHFIPWKLASWVYQTFLFPLWYRCAAQHIFFCCCMETWRPYWVVRYQTPCQFSTNIRLDNSTGSFHTVHHLNAKSNFGQLTTLWDQLMGTYLDTSSYIRKQGMFQNARKNRPSSNSKIDKFI
jgi:sterol desaturase/sphingolipid hydroxylase (fatty acid hydroxylase superfamily)